MIFLYAFLVGGVICMLAQLVQDFFKLTPGHVTAIFVSLGALLDFFDIYDKLLDFSEAGAMLPITNFGHSLAHSAYESAINTNYFGILTGMFSKVTAGIVLAIVLSVVAALVSKPRN